MAKGVQNIKDKTHYRKAFNSPYLSSADIVGDTGLTIKYVKLEPDKSKKTQDSFNTAYFSEKELRPGEPLKPMILNAGNSKIMRDITGSSFIDDWINVPVTVWVDHAVRFGRDTVEGLRLRKSEPLEPPSDEQMAAIQDYRDAGAIPQEIEDWLSDNELSYKSAARLLGTLKGAD